MSDHKGQYGIDTDTGCYPEPRNCTVHGGHVTVSHGCAHANRVISQRIFEARNAERARNLAATPDADWFEV